MNSQRKQMLQESIDYLKHDARMPSMANAFSELMDDYEKLHARITELEKDAERLDWMDSQVKHHQYYTGYEWQENGYENDRGLTCKIQTKKNRMSARQAIDTAMQKD